MALAADVVAGPPAVVATAREVDVIDGPCPLRERRRGAGGRRRRRPSALEAHIFDGPRPYGRGAVELGTDVVAGPPAVVAAATREVDVVNGPRLLRERRRGAGGRLRRRPSCRRRRRQP